jgi:hypothetical protein
MSYLHNIDFEKLTTDFKDIIDLEKTYVEYKKTLHDKLGEIKNTYQYLIKNNNKKIFLFCLDSFFFQYKCHSTDFENFAKSATLITNRMYGDYYKLYNILITQLKDKNTPLKTIEEPKKFPAYKDLEPFHEYAMSETVQIHNAIMEIIVELNQHHMSLEKTAYQYSITSHVGMSITNFMHTLQYENMLIREQIHLYVNYLSFFHESHHTYLKKLVNKIDAFRSEMEEEIKNTNQSFDMSNVDLECIYTISDTVKIDNLLEKSEEIIEQTETILQEIENRANVDSLDNTTDHFAEPSDNVIESTNDASDIVVESVNTNAVVSDEVVRIENTNIE